MLTDWTYRLRSLLRRSVVDRELDDEMRFHLEQQVDTFMRQGLTRDDAVRRAALEFGSLDAIREEHRDARGIAVLAHLARDLRLALRQLRRAPTFSALAVLCLGLGIGVNTSIFGVLNAVMFKPLPVADPDRLVMMSRGADASFSFPAYRDYRERTRTLTGLTATMPSESDLEIDGDSQFVAAEAVAGNYAGVMGVRAALGRWFVNDDDAVAVISYTLWQRRFDLSPTVLGRRVNSESQTYTIVGVAPRDYGGVFSPIRTDLWVPLLSRPAMGRVRDDPTARQLMLFARLATNVVPSQVATEMNTLDARLTAEQGRRSEVAVPLVVDHVRGISNPGNRRSASVIATFLLVVVGLVLLIACVNVGNLLLVRGTVRQREFAVRRALGGSRGRLMQQLLTETLVIATAGGLLGLVLARWTTALLQRSLPMIQGVFQAQLDFSFDWRVLIYATLVSVVTMVLCGLVPAWRASQTSALVAFKGEIAVGRPRRRPLGLVAQVVMSFVLLVICGTFIEALLRMQTAAAGFAVTGRLYAFTFIATPGIAPADGRRIYAQALERLRAVPGVRTATISDSLPLLSNSSDCVAIDKGARVSAIVYTVQPGYFDTMDIGVRAGRDFNIRDEPGDATAVIVNERLAHMLWPNTSPVGQQLALGCNATRSVTVIGVVNNSAIRSIGEVPRPQIFVNFAGHYAGGLTAILLETSTPPGRMVETVRHALLEMNQGIRVYTVEPLSQHVEKSFAAMRWQSSVLTTFGLLALILAAVGLYGVIAYRVALRTREIGVRMALGAGRRQLFREVVGQGLSIAIVGVLIGEALAILIGRVLGSINADLQPAGLVVLVATGMLWIAVALLATYVPAARASSVNPLIALRTE